MYETPIIERIIVISVETFVCIDPDIARFVLQQVCNAIIGQAIFDGIFLFAAIKLIRIARKK
jgi:hypothetical protein